MTRETLQYISAAVYAGVSVAAWRLHRRIRGERSRWLLVAFASLGAVAVIAVFLPAAGEETAAWQQLLRRGLIAAILLFPYALFRFGAGFREPARWISVTAASAMAVLMVATLLVSLDRASPAATAYVLLLGAYWTTLSVWVAQQLWRAGKNQPGVARKRMRLLGAGATALNVALILGVIRFAAQGPQTSPQVDAFQLTTTVLGWFSAALFVVGFSPPSPLRHAWRQDDERRLRRAEADLMTATTAVEVADTIVPHVSELLGGHGAALLDDRGEPLASRGFSEATLQAAARDRTETINRARLVLPLESGTLLVQANQYAPFFGHDEVELLRSLGSFIDLALGRIALFEKETQTRKELERTNEELTALVYGISHDLRSPIVTVIGYLELLASDAADKLGDEERHYLERISLSARYMDSLIRDLLELSRIGRTQTEKESIALGPLVEDIAAEVRRGNPQVRVVVADLPALHMNPVRARQLFTNLIENAVRHGGRDDITVTVSAERDDRGGAVITVADDGVGIPESYRERVFGIFERLDGEIPESSSGTGIGLAMCRKIVEQNDGSIWIHPAPVGTTFKIVVPASTPQHPSHSVEVQRQ